MAKALLSSVVVACEEKKQISGRQQLWLVYKDYQLNAERLGWFAKPWERDEAVEA